MSLYLLFYDHYEDDYMEESGKIMNNNTPHPAAEESKPDYTKFTDDWLLPCPFCGGKASAIHPTAYSAYYIECDGCGFQSNKGFLNKLVPVWNRRPAPEPVSDREDGEAPEGWFNPKAKRPDKGGWYEVKLGQSGNRPPCIARVRWATSQNGWWDLKRSDVWIIGWRPIKARSEDSPAPAFVSGDAGMEERANKYVDKYVPSSGYWDGISPHGVAHIVYGFARQERERIIAEITNGDYCRMVDHMQDACMCDDIRRDFLGAQDEQLQGGGEDGRS